MNDFVKLGIWVVIVGVAFAIMWRKGVLLRISNYVAETREELRKCSWPSSAELKESTVVVTVTIGLLSAFTVAVDFLISMFVRLIT